MMHSSSGVADIVRLVTKIGPDVGEISRRLGIFKETVRYRYKHLLEKGFAVQVAPNYERLGLRRIVGTVDFAPEFKPYAEAILSTMGKFCYLGSYARTVPAGTYVLHVNAPKEYSNEWIRFADALK
jgi:DNA-binding Lrp family transcriptional regulator